MKRKILLIILLSLEFIMYFLFTLCKVNVGLQSVPPFNIIYIIALWFLNVTNSMMNGLHLNSLFNAMLGNELPNLNIFLSIVFFNIIFIILYIVIADVVTLITNNVRDKKVRKIVAKYELSSNEYDKFNYKHYMSRFPLKRPLSLIIPLSFSLLFIFTRFDATICNELNSVNKGGLFVSKNVIEPLFNELLKPIDFHAWLIDVYRGYIGGIDTVFRGFTWIEYVFIVIGVIALLFIWYGFFTLIHLIIRKPCAKYKANKDRINYVRKMEYIEYKLKNKYKDETSIKSDEFMHIVEKEQREAAREIARFKKNPEDEQKEARDSELKKKAYYEEIGQGVTDLGVSNENPIDFDTPIVERQVKYISDEEVDIILDEEPVIEIVEDDKEERNIEFGRESVFFERYQPDDFEIKTVEEYSGLSFRNEVPPNEEKEVEPIITENDNLVENEDKEEKATINEEETLIEIKEDIPSKEEHIEEVIKEDVSSNVEHVEEEIKEEVTPIEESDSSNTLIETTNDVLEIKEDETLSLDKNEEKEEETIIEANNEDIVSDTNEEKPVKVDPFAKWRGRRNAPGYGAKRVPSFKELKEKLKEDLK